MSTDAYFMRTCEKVIYCNCMYFAYILKCADGTLYCGCTNNLDKRLHEHNNLKSGAHYTKIRRPVKLVYSELCSSLSQGRAREAELKRLTRKQKESLIEGKGSSILASMKSFEEHVLEVVKNIPEGSVMTYGEVAKKAGNARASRAVGNLMAKNADKAVPCHRVVRSDGSIGMYNGLRGKSKETLLKKEGILFKGNKIIF